jgi:hypothetical protein
MKARSIAIGTAIFAATIAASASAECPYPKAPHSAPNGSKATEAEMIAGMTAIKNYDTEVQAYIACLDTEATARIAEAGDKTDQVSPIKAMNDKKQSAALKDLHSHADDFNAQLKAYKAKQKS